MALMLLPAATASGQVVELTNGLGAADPGYYRVGINEQAYSEAAYINLPVSGLLENINYSYAPFLQVGGAVYSSEQRGGSGLGLDNWGSGTWVDDDPSDLAITSEGVTGGVSWSVTHSMPAGGSVMTSRWTMDLGGSAVRLFVYLDEDVDGGVVGFDENILVISGSIADGDLNLLTALPDEKAGVSHWADDQATGWAADAYSDLLDLLSFDPT
jgi:hypothetical protein